MVDEISPAQRSLEAHLSAVRFQSGIEEGRWNVLLYGFPHLYVHITGENPESISKMTHDFHLECEDYPATGPFVESWAYEENETHGQCSLPPTAGSPGFMDAFKSWDKGKGGIYRGWQRGAATHNDWAKKWPEEAWHKDRDITFIMEKLYELLSEQAVWLASKA